LRALVAASLFRGATQQAILVTCQMAAPFCPAMQNGQHQFAQETNHAIE
jgi:hypothetical protein